jgi:hypothetical protein
MLSTRDDFYEPCRQCSNVPFSLSLTGVSDPDLGQDMAVGKLGTQAEKDRRLKKK